MTLVINLFGGPGTGKSTTMAGVFNLLKLSNINAEMAPEYAKDKVWEKSLNILNNQIYIFGKQHHRIFRLQDEVDVIVTDSPLLLSLHYGAKMSASFKALVIEEHHKMNNFNIFLRRVKPFQSAGRTQSETEAKKIDTKLKNILNDHNIRYDIVAADNDAAGHIAQEAYLRFLR